MHRSLLATAFAGGFILSASAYAQNAPLPAAPAATTTDQTSPDGSDQSAAPSKMVHHSARSAPAGNIGASDTHGKLASKLPSPKLGPDATPSDFLNAAQNSLSRHRMGEAQAALEMAETRALDRSTAASDANQPDQSPQIKSITDALDALSHKDIAGAKASITQAMQQDGSSTISGGMSASDPQSTGMMKGMGMTKGTTMMHSPEAGASSGQ